MRRHQQSTCEARFGDGDAPYKIVGCVAINNLLAKLDLAAATHPTK
ncbi:MAG: hypothetical protein QQW96_24565 [Tychonema bourrellyi B0820]|nr:hypothetical protein [Tychonema bourrellyi]MDQ2100806.1 hypothetical protein [Tychonema bourrellyi B0820]